MSIVIRDALTLLAFSSAIFFSKVAPNQKFNEINVQFVTKSWIQSIVRPILMIKTQCYTENVHIEILPLTILKTARLMTGTERLKY